MFSVVSKMCPCWLMRVMQTVDKDKDICICKDKDKDLALCMCFIDRYLTFYIMSQSNISQVSTSAINDLTWQRWTVIRLRSENFFSPPTYYLQVFLEHLFNYTLLSTFLRALKSLRVIQILPRQGGAQLRSGKNFFTHQLSSTQGLSAERAHTRPRSYGTY